MTETQTKTFFSRFSRLFCLILALGCLAGAPRAVLADENFYVVQDIAVDETAASAAKARTVAVAKGQERAFAALLRRLVPASHHDRLPALSESDITPLVASFQVANERSSAKRYLADLTFEFKRDDIRSLLRADRLPFSEAVARPILVLPVYQEDGQANLWAYPNPWRSVWVDVIDYGVRPQAPDALRDDWAQPFVQPVLVPAGDIADMRSIDGQKALAMDPSAIDTLKRNYDVSAVHVISVTPRSAPDGTPLLDVSHQRSDREGPATMRVFRGTEDHEMLMQSVVFNLLGELQEEWKSRNVLDFGTETTLAVTTKIRDLPGWLTLQRQVESLSNVSGVKIRDLSVEEAFWNITYIGSMDQLVAALDRRNLALVEHMGYWTLDPK
tara:strand:- start:2297 stop:3451 length:1155 start_codon:yes stop_codon:yes gene_type:complete